MSRGLFSVVIVVTDDQQRYLERCVDRIRGQSYGPIELVVVDNTADQLVQIDQGGSVSDVVLLQNVTRPSWFCTNYNLGMRRAGGDAILALNLDAFLEPRFVDLIRRVLERKPDVGLVSGKLLRAEEDGKPLRPPTIDSAGIVFTLDQRHLDRGAGSPDRAIYDRPRYIAGVTGAALTIRRTTRDDIAINGACFDPDFVHGREDGDLCLRAQVLGWKCYYEPAAVAYHIRTMRPGLRKRLPALINCHQVKNRFLLRMNNLPAFVVLVLSPWICWRDLQVVVYVLTFERSSIPAFAWLWRNRRRLLAKRRRIVERRRAGLVYLIILFCSHFASRLAVTLDGLRKSALS